MSVAETAAIDATPSVEPIVARIPSAPKNDTTAAPADGAPALAPGVAGIIEKHRHTPGNVEGFVRKLLAHPTETRKGMGDEFGISVGNSQWVIRELLAIGALPSQKGAVSYSPEQRDSVVALIREGIGDVEISERVGVTRMIVKAIAKKEGLPSARQRAAARLKPKLAFFYGPGEEAVDVVARRPDGGCASLGCTELAEAGKNTCSLHVALTRGKTRRAPPRISDEERARQVAERVAAGAVTRCPPQGPEFWSPKRPITVVDEPAPRRREPSTSIEERRQIDLEERRLERDFARAVERYTRGEPVERPDPSLVVGLDAAADLAGIEPRTLRRLSDEGEVIGFQWRNGRRVYKADDLKTLAERLEREEDVGGGNEAPAEEDVGSNLGCADGNENISRDAIDAPADAMGEL